VEYEWLPLFDWGALPEAEHDKARHVQTQLLALTQLEDRFRSAIELIEHANELIRPRVERGESWSDVERQAYWRQIGAGHAVLILYHFRSTLLSIQTATGNCPTLKRKVLLKELQEAIDQFHFAFPHWRKMRHAVTHIGDAVFEADATRDAMATYFLHGYMIDWTLTLPREGGLVSQSVTSDELFRLTRVKQAAFRAFRKVALLPPEDQTSRRSRSGRAPAPR
jgi:hypothetical protein